MSEACVILNDIHIDIMDYIKPAYCNEAQVRSSFLTLLFWIQTDSRFCSSGACGPSSSGRTGSMWITRCRMWYSCRRLVVGLTVCRDPREYLAHVMKATNMSCLTPEGATSGDCDFLSANMYARSLFGASFRLFFFSCNDYSRCTPGEDALANLSVERTAAGTITGHVRIRSKTQGIALSLGDRITMGKNC